MRQEAVVTEEEPLPQQSPKTTSALIIETRHWHNTASPRPRFYSEVSEPGLMGIRWRPGQASVGGSSQQLLSFGGVVRLFLIIQRSLHMTGHGQLVMETMERVLYVGRGPGDG